MVHVPTSFICSRWRSKCITALCKHFDFQRDFDFHCESPWKHGFHHLPFLLLVDFQNND